MTRDYDYVSHNTYQRLQWNREGNRFKKRMNIETKQITIDRVGPYGVQVQGAWWGVNAPLTPASFVKGQTVTVNVKTGGKKPYITQIVEASAPPAVSSAPAPISSSSAPTGPLDQYGRPMSEYALGKDRQMCRSGILQSVFQSPALVAFATTEEEYLKTVERVYKWGMDLVKKEI